MIPLFTLVTSVLTIAITALLTWALWRINRPRPGQGSQPRADAGAGGDGGAA